MLNISLQCMLSANTSFIVSLKFLTIVYQMDSVIIGTQLGANGQTGATE